MPNYFQIILNNEVIAETNNEADMKVICKAMMFSNPIADIKVYDISKKAMAKYANNGEYIIL